MTLSVWDQIQPLKVNLSLTSWDNGEQPTQWLVNKDSSFWMTLDGHSEAHIQIMCLVFAYAALWSLVNASEHSEPWASLSLCTL